ncbi:MAG: flagellar motor protein MotB [Gammaproteobacteria bacterium]
MASNAGDKRPIIVKKKKIAAAGHHGGAWKVAYADFVTAMMAFFMVMWLVTAVSKEQRAAIFDYFKNPSMEPGKSTKPAPGQMGPGGASTSPIDLRGGLDAPRTTQSAKPGVGIPQPTAVPVRQGDPSQSDADKIKADAMALEKAQAELDKKRMEALMQELKEAISKSQALEPFKDQLLLDITPEGLRIQIVDAQNRPMFDIGSAKLKGYTGAILRELTPYLNSVPNHVSLTGHTDTTPYAGITGYTNWDLSTDRANAARRSLEGAGLASDKVSRVVGLSSSVLFDRTNPRNPINRRISIVVLTKEAEQEAQKTDIPMQMADAGMADGSPSSTASAAGAPGAAADLPNGGDQLAMTGGNTEPGSAGPITAIDKPINTPMGSAPVALPASATTTAPTAPQPAAAPRHPIPTK